MCITVKQMMQIEENGHQMGFLRKFMMENAGAATVKRIKEKYGMMWDLDKKTRMDRTEELLTAFNLVEFRKKRNEDLSIGQRRRVQVAVSSCTIWICCS